MNRPWALVPIKSFAAGKSRLQTVLDSSERRTLAQTMCTHTLSVLCQSRALGGVLVMTRSTAVARVAYALGAAVMPDPSRCETLSSEHFGDTQQATLGRVVDAGIDALRRHGARGVITLMSDLPMLTRDDIAELVAMLDAHDVVIAPDTCDAGTNALCLNRAATLPTCFGHTDSFERHCRRSRTFDLRLGILRSPTLAFDIDTPEDFERLLTAPPGSHFALRSVP